MEDKRRIWQRWATQPQTLWLHNALFQVHFWIGATAGLYLSFMGITGGIIVFRNELSRWFSVEWIVRLHSNLLAGAVGRFVNGIGAIALTSLAVTGAMIWWPGLKFWRRSLTVNWRSNFPRINWDLHSALGFWTFFFVLLWGISGIYLTFPEWFSPLFLLDPADRFIDRGLLLL